MIKKFIIGGRYRIIHPDIAICSHINDVDGSYHKYLAENTGKIIVCLEDKGTFCIPATGPFIFYKESLEYIDRGEFPEYYL